MAGHPMFTIALFELGFAFGAIRLCYRTTGMKTTPRWWIDRAGHIAFQMDTLFSTALIDFWYGRKQTLCIWMLRIIRHIGH